MDGRGCTWRPELAVEDGRYARIPHAGPANCHDCAAPHGTPHHPGCDTERCPRCLGQAISCGCHWEGDAADEDGEEERIVNPESPQAVRIPG